MVTLKQLTSPYVSFGVYLVIILIGIALSMVVFSSVKRVENNTTQLVNDNFPAFQEIQHLHRNFVEQELILYEYYSTMNEDTFHQRFSRKVNTTRATLLNLSQYFENQEKIKNLASLLTEVVRLSEKFNKNMIADDLDWDLAREVLVEITHQRALALPILTQLKQQINQTVTDGQEGVFDSLTQTLNTVIFYSLSIILIALAVGQLIGRLLRMSDTNIRLAAFARKNPHPILSLDGDANIVFANPACIKLLASQGLEKTQLEKLIPDDFAQIKKRLEKGKQKFVCVEHSLGEKVLECELQWLNKLQSFDLHITDVTSKKEAEEKLNFQAFHNKTTGLENQNQLDNQSNRLIQNEQKNFTLGLIKIRRFNQFISTHGIDVSAAISHAFANGLESTIFMQGKILSMSLYQQSASNFAVIIYQAMTMNDIEKVVSTIKQNFPDTLTTPFGDFHCEMDFGFCQYPQHSQNRNELFSHARLALDDAISLPDKDWTVYSHELGEKFEQSRQLEKMIKSALKNDEFEVVYQPQFDIKKQQNIGLEALVRWNNNDNPISPAVFIPVAEQTGDIIELGQWILNTACAQAVKFVELGLTELVMAVNISPRQFQHPDFCDVVEQALIMSGLPPKNLELEITEGVVLHNEAHTKEILIELKKMGIALSIDDFGTGYSSLSYLKTFPLDKLKIDQSFIRHLHESVDDQSITKTIIDLGQNLHLKVIAEGVENVEQLQILSKLGCDEIQGYYYAKPLSKEKCQQFLFRNKTIQLKLVKERSITN